MSLTATEQIAPENSNPDPRRQDGVMITGVEIQYRAETLSFPEAGLTDAHSDPPQTADLSVAASTNHKVCGGGGGDALSEESPFSQDAEG